MKKYTAVFALLLVIVGCATSPSGEKFTEVEKAPNEKALVYVYRPADNYIYQTIIFNGQEIGDLHSLGYFSILLDSGRYAFDRGDGFFSLDVKAGKVYFVEFKLPSDYGKPGNNDQPTFRIVDSSVAIENLKNMRKENGIGMKVPAVPELATEVSLPKLISASEENQVAFENTYKNKLIKVNGTVSTVSPHKEYKSTYVMFLESLEPLPKARHVVPTNFMAYCYSENKAYFEQLRKGQKLTITGRLYLEVFGSYIIEDCVINE